MIVILVLNGLIIISLAHSYLTKSIHHIKIQIIILHLINSGAMLTPVAQESGHSPCVRECQLVIHVILFGMQTVFISAMARKHVHLILMVWANVMFMWIIIIYQKLKTSPTGQSREIMTTGVLGIFTTLVASTFFTHVQSNIQKLVARKEISNNELLKQKDLFDGLQEGIVVIEDSSEMVDSNILFCNDLATRILKKVINKDQQHTKKEKAIDLSSNIFFEYKNITHQHKNEKEPINVISDRAAN